MKRVMWKTRYGVVMPLNHMTDSHIANAIAKIEREQWRMESLPYLRAEQERRKTEPPTAEESIARIIGEAEEAQWREEHEEVKTH